MKKNEKKVRVYNTATGKYQVADRKIMLLRQKLVGIGLIIAGAVPAIMLESNAGNALLLISGLGLMMTLTKKVVWL